MLFHSKEIVAGILDTYFLDCVKLATTNRNDSTLFVHTANVCLFQCFHKLLFAKLWCYVIIEIASDGKTKKKKMKMKEEGTERQKRRRRRRRIWRRRITNITNTQIQMRMNVRR